MAVDKRARISSLLARMLEWPPASGSGDAVALKDEFFALWSDMNKDEYPLELEAIFRESRLVHSYRRWFEGIASVTDAIWDMILEALLDDMDPDSQLILAELLIRTRSKSYCLDRLLRIRPPFRGQHDLADAGLWLKTVSFCQGASCLSGTYSWYLSKLCPILNTLLSTLRIRTVAREILSFRQCWEVCARTTRDARAERLRDVRANSRLTRATAELANQVVRYVLELIAEGKADLIEAIPSHTTAMALVFASTETKRGLRATQIVYSAFTEGRLAATPVLEQQFLDTVLHKPSSIRFSR